MIYKMYKMVFSEVPDPDQDLSYFEKLYSDNGVEIVGEWQNVDNPKEMYFITGYRDEAHHKQFVDAAARDEKYKEINAYLNSIRESVEAITLERTSFG